MSDAQDTLNKLYPHVKPQANSAVDRDLLLRSIAQKSATSAATQTTFFEQHSTELIDIANALVTRFSAGGKLLCMGNGGSSCDAAHLAVEFNHPVTTGRRALPAINLAADTAMLTAVANDVGIDEVFLRQVDSLGRPEDILFGISTSGNASNLLAAFKHAKRMGICCIALLGGDGGRIALDASIDHCLTVDSDSIHRIQECHVLSYHILWDLVHSIGVKPQ